MFGSSSLATARASRRNRSRYEESFTRLVGSTLIATRRFMSSCSARYTLLMPPLPIWPSSLYLPSRKPRCLPGKQLIGLPASDEALSDHQIGELWLVFEDRFAVLLRGLVQKRRQLGLVNEVAAPQQVDQLVGGHLRHCA